MTDFLDKFKNQLKEMPAGGRLLTRRRPEPSPNGGEPINAPKYGTELEGKVLGGQQILEIPENNQRFNQIQEYIDLAKNKYNIEIRFRAE